MYLLTTLQPKTGCAHPTEQPPSCRSSRVSKISQAACPPLPLLAGVRQLQVSAGGVTTFLFTCHVRTYPPSPLLHLTDGFNSWWKEGSVLNVIFVYICLFQVSEDYLCRRHCCLCSPVARFSLSSRTVVATAQGYRHTWWLVELPFRTLDSERGRSTG